MKKLKKLMSVVLAFCLMWGGTAAAAADDAAVTAPTYEKVENEEDIGEEGRYILVARSEDGESLYALGAEQSAGNAFGFMPVSAEENDDGTVSAPDAAVLAFKTLETGYSVSGIDWSVYGDNTITVGSADEGLSLICVRTNGEGQEAMRLVTLYYEDGATETMFSAALLDELKLEYTYSSAVLYAEKTHVHTYTRAWSEPVWKDNTFVLSCAFTCTEGDDTRTLTADVKGPEVVREVTCTGDGLSKYVASVTFEGGEKDPDDDKITIEASGKSVTYTKDIEATMEAPGHKLVHVGAKAATETEDGNVEYYVCSVCGKYFIDDKAADEVTEEEITLPKTGEGSEDDKPDETGDAVKTDMPDEEAGITAPTTGETEEQTPAEHAPQPVILPESADDTAWIERDERPDYAKTLYQILVDGSDYDRIEDLLIADDAFTLPRYDAAGRRYPVEEAMVGIRTEPELFAAEIKLSEDVLADDGLLKVGVSGGDKAVDYANLKVGDLVKTTAFNGVYVTSIPRSGNANFEADRVAVFNEIQMSVHAFYRDHPEVFWLTEQTKVKMVVPTINRNGQQVQECFFFFVIADADGFVLRQRNFSSADSIQTAIGQREAAVKEILAGVTATDLAGQVRALNDALTARNQYNTSADLNAIGTAPHRCLSALTGSIGTVGPVCDGYSKAFKVLCDRLGIPCVLEEGYALVDPATGASGAHMWNCVKTADGKWYGVDVTWDDPIIAGSTTAVSGYENQNYLMVGSDTVIGGLKFSQSHIAQNLVQTANIASGIVILNPTALSGLTVSVPGLAGFARSLSYDGRFGDVAADAWYAESVTAAYELGLMNGISDTAFDPAGNITIAQTVTVASRLRSIYSGDSYDFSGVDPWYQPYVDYAKTHGILTGDYADFSAPATREIYAAIVGAALPDEALPAINTVEDNAIPDVSADDAHASAIYRLYRAGILTGNDAAGTFTPQNPITRAEVAAILSRLADTGLRRSIELKG